MESVSRMDSISAVSSMLALVLGRLAYEGLAGVLQGILPQEVL